MRWWERGVGLIKLKWSAKGVVMKMVPYLDRLKLCEINIQKMHPHRSSSTKRCLIIGLITRKSNTGDSMTPCVVSTRTWAWFKDSRTFAEGRIWVMLDILTFDFPQDFSNVRNTAFENRISERWKPRMPSKRRNITSSQSAQQLRNLEKPTLRKSRRLHQQVEGV